MTWPEIAPVAIPAAAFVAGAFAAFVLLRQRMELELVRKDAVLSSLRSTASRVPDLEERLDRLQADESDLKSIISSLETRLQDERAATGEKMALMEEAREHFAASFQALSGEALQRNNHSFLELAAETLSRYHEGAKLDLLRREEAIEHLTAPLRESLERVDRTIQDLEKARLGAYESVTEQIRTMSASQRQLLLETGNLVQALRSPVTRGRWGEIQLRRVVEMAGMVDHCDFFEQITVSNDDIRFRPDLLVRLPAGKNVVVDAKTPLKAYLDAIDEGDADKRKEQFYRHAQQVRTHIELLARKAYWDQFEQSPEFVVLFLPGEAFFSAALEHDPALIEFGADRRVILATPTTLIALLRAVFHGWKQERLAQNAREISDLGRELFKRLADMGTHIDKLGRSLGSAVESYNRAVGSLETRVMVTARKLRELEVAPVGMEIPPLPPLEQTPRTVSETVEQGGGV